MEIQNQESEQKEYIKITKNSRGFNYEVKVLELNTTKIKEITNELDILYGSTNTKQEN